MFFIYPYMTGSKSVKKLKELLEGKIIKLEGSKYRPKSDHIVINYGNSREPEWKHNAPNIINEPSAVAIASNKLDTFNVLARETVPTVPFTTSRTEAQAWLDEGSKVFVRNKLNGHSGDGIEVVEPTLVSGGVDDFTQDVHDIINELSYSADTASQRNLVEALAEAFAEAAPEPEMTQSTTLPEAPLYTRGIPNAGEYRVHVVGDEVILYQKKSRKVDEDGNVITAVGEEADIRNLASNWVYRTGNLKRLERVETLAINAIAALGLDFGAVDIIMDEDGDVFVLEVNTAPGLGNTDTQEAYKNAFLRLAGISADDEIELAEFLDDEDEDDDLRW